jgi:PAS domain S-box-containing protein
LKPPSTDTARRPLTTTPWWSRGTIVTRVCIGAAALVLVRMGFGLAYEWRLFERTAITEVTRLARLLEGQANRAIESADQVLAADATILAAAQGKGVDGARLEELLGAAPASNPLLRSVSLVDAQGRVLGSSAPGLTGLMLDLDRIGRPAPGQAGRLGVLVAGRDLDVLALPAAATPLPNGALGFVPMVRAAHARGEPRRYLVAALNMDQLGLGFTVNLANEAVQAALLRVDGAVMASTPGLSSLVGQSVAAHSYARQLQANAESGYLTGDGLLGGRVYGAFRALRGFPLAVVVEHNQREAMAVQFEGRLIARVIGDVLALLVVAAAWYIVRKHGAARIEMATALQVNEGQRQQSEQALALLVESVREIIFRTDLLGQVTFVNRRWEDTTGYPETEIVGRHLADLVDPEDRARVEALFRTTPGTPADPVLVRLRGRSETLSLELSVTPLAGVRDQGAGFAGVAYDQTERQTVRERLQDRLDFAMRLVEVSPTAMFAKDTEGRYIEVNRAFLDLVGLSLQQVLGKTGRDLFPDPDGRTAAADEHVLRTGETVSYESPLAAPDGTVRAVRVTKSRLNHGSGKPAGIVGSSVDVTVYRQAEKAIRDARDASVRTARAKLEFERGFLSMAAHELRTPLTSLRLQAELIVDAPTEKDRRGLSRDLLASVDRIGHVLEQLMILSRVDGLRYSELDLVEVDLEATYFKVMSPLQDEAAERGIRLRSKLRGSHVSGVEFGIYTLIRNLLHNAILYTPPGGTVAIEAHLDQGRRVLTVDDSGPGIPPDKRAEAFDRFNRLGQQKIKGSGLGLSIVKTIASLHGAAIRLETSSLGGLQVVVEFPAEPPAVPQFLDSNLVGLDDTRPAPL